MKLRNLFPMIGLVLFIYIILKIGINNLLNALLLINPIYIFINIVLVFVTFLPPAYKWGLLLRSQGVNVSFINLSKMFLISTFYGNVTPGKVGTFIRVYYLRDIIKKPLGFCSSSVFIDRMLDLLVLVLFSLGGILLISKEYLWFFWLLLGLFIISLLSFIIIINKNKSKIILKFIYNYLTPKRFKTIAKENYINFYDNIPKFRKLFVPILITIISWILAYSLPYIFLISLGVKLNYFYYILLYALSTLITLIPITLAGLGTREASLIVLLGFYNVSSTDVVLSSLLSFIIYVGITSIMGWYLSIKWKVDVS